ncbi:MAG: EAL domain-containing protein [Pseudomonadota bacterium]
MDLENLIDKIPSLAVDAVCVAHRLAGTETYGIVWTNDAFCQMFLTTRQTAEGCDPFDLYHTDYVADFRSALKEMEAAGQASFSQDTLCLRSDNSSFWGGVSFIRASNKSGPDEYAIIFVRDIDTLKNREQSAELALIENEYLLAKFEAVQARLVSAINMSPDPFCVYDARDRLVIWNTAFAEIVSPEPDALTTGTKHQKVIETCLSNGYMDDALGREQEFLSDYMAAWRAGRFVSPIMRVQGRDYKIIRAQPPNGDRVLLCVDISEQLRQQRELESYAQRLEEANREISEQALHDELTGLGNRRYLSIKLDEMIKGRKTSGLEIAALHIDLDRFKQINDTMGHAAGDHVLKQVSEILSKRVRAKDVVARIGGDEFIVLTLCAHGSETPERLADRLIEEISVPIMFEDRACRIGASVGIARTPTVAESELLTCSDIALYKAKTGGRAMKATFDQGDLDALRSMKRLGDDILRGLDEGEFMPLFQPQVDMTSGKVVSYEVIGHWLHPTRGLLRPSDFRTTAMEIQVDGQINERVFQAALSEGSKHFDGQGTLPMLTFDIGMSRLMAPEFLDELSSLDYPGQIGIALAETIFLEDEPVSVLERIEAVRSLGLSIEVADFGSGRASIVGLRRIAPDRLKIDRRLVEPITSSESAAQLVGSILQIGRTLGMDVVADGADTKSHADTLVDLGFTLGQGAVFSPVGALNDFNAQTKLFLAAGS